MEHIKDIEIGEKVLEVYRFKCCNVLTGVDHDHLNEMGDIFIPCPKCGQKCNTGTEV